MSVLLRPSRRLLQAPPPGSPAPPPSLRRPAAGAPITKSSSVGGEICSLGRDDDDDDKKRRSSFGAKMMGLVGLGKKSQSASQLNPEGQNQAGPGSRLQAPGSRRPRVITVCVCVCVNRGGEEEKSGETSCAEERGNRLGRRL